MSIQAVAWVLDFSESEGLNRLVLISIANHYNNDDGYARPSMRRIGAEAHISTNTVMSAVRRLAEIGELEVVDPGSNRTAAKYALPLMPRPVDKPLNQRRESETQRRDQRLNSVATASRPDRDRTYNQEPIKTAQPPCPDCGWVARFANFKGQVDEAGWTHPQRHSEAISAFVEKKAASE